MNSNGNPGHHGPANTGFACCRDVDAANLVSLHRRPPSRPTHHHILESNPLFRDSALQSFTSKMRFFPIHC
ncbi:hypothetical protein BGLA2_210046 [Burkholderia gladioli]|nr:hypothetical protein BGLA2_210046 [Burkholderia gladioli]